MIPMSRSRYALVCAVAVVAASLLPIATAELPDHDDEIFTWSVGDSSRDAPPGSLASIPNAAARLSCMLMSGDPTGISAEPDIDSSDPVNATVRITGPWNSSPCEATGYEIGHTDEYVFFRWNVATLEFSELTGDGFTLHYDTSLRGNHSGNDEYKRNFNFKLGVNSEEAWVENAEALIGVDELEDWTEHVEVGIDRAAGHLTAALPMELLETRVDMDGGTIVGQSFEVTSPPNIVLFNDNCDPIAEALGTCPANLDEFPTDDVSSAVNELNATYWIGPVGDLEPRVIEETVTDDTIDVDLRLKDPTWETYEYLWDASGFDGFDIDHEVELKNGTVTIAVVGPEGEDYYNVALDEPDEEPYVANATFQDLDPGEWTLRLELTEWVQGNITLGLTGIEPVIEGENDGEEENGEGASETDGEDHENHQTNGTGDDGVDDEKTPAPGAILVILAALGGLKILRRRR